MALLRVLLLTLLLGLPAFAQTVEVRTGEHAGFTRIVVPMPKGQHWAVRSSERSVILSVSAEQMVFDVSTVFDRIPRTRVLDVSQSGPGEDLIVLLGCNCQVNSFRASNSLIAIDVSGGSEGSEGASFTLPVVARPGVLHQSSLGTALSVLDTQAGPASPVLEKPLERIPIATTLKSSEQRLLKQLDRATQQGVVKLDQAGSVEIRQAIDADTLNLPSHKVLQIAAVTVFDQEIESMTQKQKRTPEQSCLPDSATDVSAWATETSFSEQIVSTRANLYGEFERVNPKAMMDLVRLYLHFGFGREAELVLGLGQESSVNVSILRAMARSVDDIEQTDELLLAGQQHCEGSVALWSLLSEARLNEDANLNAIQKANARLPAHLRMHLGPRVAEILVEGGRPDIAKAVLRNATRAKNVDVPAVELAEAMIASAEENYPKALENAEKVASTESELTARALIAQIETLRKTGETLQPNVPELIDAFAVEYRDAPVAEDLKRARILAYAMVGRFDVALSELELMKPIDSSLAVQLLPLLTDLADDITFLGYVLAHQSEVSDMAESGAVLATARRLLGLGFPGPARAILDKASESDVDDTRRLLRAEAALADGKPHHALVDVLGLSGPEADKVRVSAMWQNQNYAEAAELAAKIRDDQSAARGFFLTGNYDAIPEGETRFVQAGDAARQLIRQETVELPPLKQAHALLDESALTRAEINLLLEETSTLQQGVN